MSAANLDRLLKTALATGLVIVAVWLLTPSLTQWHRSRLARELFAQLEETPDAEVKVPLRQLDALDAAGLDPLVLAATSPRTAVAQQAQRILSEKTTRWKLLAKPPLADEATQAAKSSLCQLAHSLASRANHLSPSGKQWAEQIALSLIDFAEALPAEQSAPLLLDCSQVLAAIPPRGPRLRTLATRESRPAPSRSLKNAEPQLDGLTRLSDSSLDHLARIEPRSDLEFRQRITEAPPQPPQIATQPLPHPSAELHWLSDTPSAPAAPQPLPLAEENMEGMFPESQNSLQSEPPQTSIVDVPTPPEMASLASRYRQATLSELLQRLPQAGFHEAGIIRTVLTERGFESTEVALLQRLSAPAKEERLQLIQECSALPAVTSAWMLRRLVHDRDAEVRLKALTALATMQTPDLRELAHELAVHDEDPRVAQLASQLLKSQR